MAEKGEGGLASLLGKAEKWLSKQGVTHEDLEKAKADHESREAEQADARQAEERAGRSARAGESSVTLRGAVNGAVDSGLSAQTEQDGDQLFVTVEPVDPVPLDGGSFLGFTFSIPSHKGPGTYDLGSSDPSSIPYELWIEGSEGYFWAREYGPGVVTVAADGKTMQVHFVFRDPGSNQVDLEGTIRLS